MKARKPKMGRPPLPKEEAKGSLLSVRFNADERAAIDEAAEKADLSVSAWVRKTILECVTHAHRSVANESSVTLGRS